ncbi:MAG: hypothetical protein ACK2UK_16660 [Candidatus Promineifilaceae bacterium]
MASERFELRKDSTIEVVACGGDLTIRPWMQLDGRAMGEYTMEKVDGRLLFTSKSDLIINLPETFGASVGEVQGDMFVRGLTGKIDISDVSGDLILSNTSSAAVSVIKGDLLAKQITGTLVADHVVGDVVANNIDGDFVGKRIDGDTALSYVTGSVSLDNVNGDINARVINGSLATIHGRRDVNLRDLGGQGNVTADGDIRLWGGLGPKNHALSADGDVVVFWPTEAPLLLEVEASSITNRLALSDVIESDGRLTGRIGDGKTRLAIKAGGTVVLKEMQLVSSKWGHDVEDAYDYGFMTEFAELGSRLSGEISDQMTRVASELEASFGPDFVQRMAGQIAQRAGKAAKKMQEVAREDAAQTSKQQQPKQKESAADTVPSTNPEAQLKILHMVETGIISPEEASMLLDALDGD